MTLFGQRMVLHIACVSLVLIGLVNTVPAQTASTGAIAGTVTDPAGAVIPNATVTATDARTGETRTTTTSNTGAYVVSLLNPGTYVLAVTKTGFKRAERPDITVHITETVADNVQMAVGSQNETVSVNDMGELLKTEDSSLGNVVDQRQVANLPLVTRNYQQILGLSPGVSAEIFNAGEIGRGGVDGALVTGGASYSDNNFQMNGVNVNDLQGSGHFSGGVSAPNPDTIEEFKVQTGQYDASFGRNAGANVNVLTKSGTNRWHGSGWEFFRNEAMNANDYFRKQTDQPRAELRQNQFGFTFGGPIVRDKLLFFTSYQGTRQNNGIDPSCSSSVTLPVLTDDRSNAGLAAAVGATTAFGGMDPYTGNPVTAANISPQAAALFNAKLSNGQYLIPNPQVIKTDPATGLPEGFSTYSVACPYHEDQFMVNLDWLQNSKSTFQERFFYADSEATSTLPQTQTVGDQVPGSPSKNPQNFRDFSLSHTYVFTSALVNQAQIGFTRNLAGTNQSFPLKYSDIGVTAPGFDDARANISVLGGFDEGGNGQTTVIAQNNYIFQDTLSWFHGRHSFRFGGNITRSQDNISEFAFAGYTIFLDYPGLMIGDGPFNPYQSVDLAGITQRGYRVWDGSLYAQDDFKVTQRLTLNLGFRYERLGDVGENAGRNANVNPSLVNPNPGAAGSLEGIIVASNFSGQIPDGVTRASNDLAINGDGQNTWNPRIGFAWMLPGSDRFVLRGGYGLYRQRITGQPYFQLETNQPWGQYRAAVGTAGFANPFGPDPGAFPQFFPYSAPVEYLPGQFAATTTLSPFALAQNLRPPLFQQYGLNLQAQITKSTVVQVGYAGSHGTHMLLYNNLNQASAASADNPVRGQTDTTLGNFYARIPYEGFGALYYDQSTGYSWYNALQVSVEHRLSHGLQFLASYTYAKDLTSVWGATTGANGGTQVGDNFNPNRDHGPDIFIRPHRFVLSYVYEIPGFHDHGWASALLSDWKVAGVTTLQSGHLLPALDVNPTNVYTQGYNYDFATMTPGCSLSKGGSVTGRLNGWIDTTCFTSAPPASADGGTGFGNTSLGLFKGPAQASSDLSLIKVFPVRRLSEAANFEFRAEAFNVFNQVNFADPDNVFTDGPSFGTITKTLSNPRILQLALKFSF
ncbi:hypothetical protein Acid345_3831 [Candidatus Koribacter versatilis Ellin345]|uniref:Uncharacterized protein n=1 Tax=Koribacter versatilis (strain Ellin345) TaxID=204669 RepID=Q1IJW9_KORVE|nr:TonB-dependent receptor [Candidatus Koribacter versatilis]ABF42831.1 hypothetical protein Acid345_3831 [Candidatus Koribacter versatilis Ellin345]